MSWSTVRADQFCTLITDGTHDSPKPQQSGWKLITSKHLKGHYIDFDSANWISEADYLKVISRSAVEQWDILFSMIGTIGNIYLEKNPHVEYACKNIGIFKFSGNKENALWMYYYLKSPQAKAYIQTHLRGSTQAYVPLGGLREMPVPVPPQSVRNEIIAVLRPIDEKIECNNAINDNLLAQAQTLYKQFFPYGVQDDLPDGWRIGTVGEIIEIHDSKRIPLSGADRTKMEKKIYPYYGAASLMDFVDNYIFDGKYLLLGEDGTVVDDAGYPILQYVWGQFWVNNHAHILTGRLGYDVESLYMLFKQTPVKSIVTGAVQPKISQANLRSVQVVIPPEHNLREYNDLVEPLFSLFRANEEECKTFTALRDMLLPKLMSGEIDVSAVQL